MTVLDNMDGSPAQWLRHVAYVRTSVRAGICGAVTALCFGPVPAAHCGIYSTG
jgi:hypothetical protein